MSSKALVLFSGGQDSVTCLAQALTDFPGAVETVAFDYGQRHFIELDQARKVAALAGVPFRVIDLTFISQLSQNALTDSSIKIETKEGELPSTFVPGRNLFFISVGAVIAQQKNIKVVYTGVCQTDFSGYPDCRDNFIKSCEQTVNLAMDTALEIRTPLMWLTKAQTVTKMEALGHLDWYQESHTCYEGHRPACGVCPACILRLKGFAEAGVSDPLAYQVV